jgi:hypothetical protein
MVAPREPEVPREDSPRVMTVERGTGGGPAMREEADGGAATRPCRGATVARAPAAADAFVPFAAGVAAVAGEAEALVAAAPETFAAALGTFEFTKRCSLGS